MIVIVARHIISIIIIISASIIGIIIEITPPTSIISSIQSTYPTYLYQLIQSMVTLCWVP